MNTTTIVTLAVALIGPLGAYLIAMRRFSGSIGTSDAKELWEESRSIREWSQTRLTGQDATIARLEARVAALEANNSELLIQNTRQLREIVQLTENLLAAQKRIRELENNDKHQ